MTHWLALVFGTDLVSQNGALSIGFIDEKTSVQTVFSPIIPAWAQKNPLALNRLSSSGAKEH